MQTTMVDATHTLYDLVVIGGGVVGLAILRAATLQGWKCALLEAESELLSNASGSNSGIACTGVDATPGTLERALIRDAISQLRPYCQAHNLPTQPCGSLVCLWPWDGHTNYDALEDVLAESHEAGDTHAAIWTPAQVAGLEPNLNPSCLGAVHIPGEIVVDPWLYSVSLAVHARENGATIFTNFAVGDCALNDEEGIWSIQEANNINNNHQRQLRSKAVVNAAGIMADLVQSQALDQQRWAAKPRRGQYRIYESTDRSSITHPIQPVPSQFTKGIFIFRTLYNQLVVGPTALDQDSRTNRSIDPEVAEELDKIVQRAIPSIDPKRDLVGEYVGIRPGTDQRDYQIHVFPNKHWISVAGIRSTGLTASLGIGNYVARQLKCILKEPIREAAIRTTPMPRLRELIREFRNSKNGLVTLQGHRYKVTHPLTIHGWKSKAANVIVSGSKL
jgi:glycerol-3-phosphate dehydrogenase